MKRYNIRILIFDELVGNIVNDAIDCGMFKLSNSFDGINGVLAIYDGNVSRNGLIYLLALGVYVFPLDNYEDFVITCPHCGERINDDDILCIYDDKLLGGYNIKCSNGGCGYQTAKVVFLE